MDPLGFTGSKKIVRRFDLGVGSGQEKRYAFVGLRGIYQIPFIGTWADIDAGFSDDVDSLHF